MADNSKGEQVSESEWRQGVRAHRLPREELNKLVMEYLVKEGYKEAVLSFQAESGLPSASIDTGLLDEQLKIRAAVEGGAITRAVELVNDLDPEILETNPRLFFLLQQQQLLELIRHGNTEEVLRFAQSELAPRGEENPEFLDELEQTLSLLAFDGHSPYSCLLEQSQRLKVVSELNSAVLASQEQQPGTKLELLMKLVLWTQEQLAKRDIAFPRLTNTGTSSLATKL